MITMKFDDRQYTLFTKQKLTNLLMMERYIVKSLIDKFHDSIKLWNDSRNQLSLWKQSCNIISSYTATYMSKTRRIKHRRKKWRSSLL